MPYFRMSRRPESLSSVSECSSAGKPWQSQPKRRSTMLPAHGLVARHQILHEAGDDVPVVRQAVGERRPVIEDELVRRPVLDAWPIRNRGLEHPLTLPALQNLLLDAREIRVLLGGRIGLRAVVHADFEALRIEPLIWGNVRGASMQSWPARRSAKAPRRLTVPIPLA